MAIIFNFFIVITSFLPPLFLPGWTASLVSLGYIQMQNSHFCYFIDKYSSRNNLFNNWFKLYRIDTILIEYFLYHPFLITFQSYYICLLVCLKTNILALIETVFRISVALCSFLDYQELIFGSRKDTYLFKAINRKSNEHKANNRKKINFNIILIKHIIEI